MGKWPPLSWFPVPLGTPVWLSGWDPGSSPLPPSRLRANHAPHLAQIVSASPSPMSNLWQGSGLPQASFSHAAVRRTFPKRKLDHDSPAADSSQGSFKVLAWPSRPCTARPLPASPGSSSPSPCPTATPELSGFSPSLCTSYSFCLECLCCGLLCFSQNTPARTARPSAEGPPPGRFPQ